MEVNIDIKPEAPPSWALTPDAQLPKATQPQLNYIRDLASQRDLSRLTPEQRAALQQPEEFWKHETTRLTKRKAKAILDKLIPLPKKYNTGAGNKTTYMAERFAVGVPAGRYAVNADSGHLRFYHVWVSRDGKRMSVYVAHGPDQSDLKYQKTILTVLNKIKTAGIRECAIRYGNEIGECSNCGRRLTNHISRALGIGPVCGGRMFGDDFKLEVRAKRAELQAQGINPDEDVQE